MKYVALVVLLATTACADAVKPVHPSGIRALKDDCDTTSTLLESSCTQTGSSGPTGIWLPGMTPDYCFNPQQGNDDDEDGLANDCEQAMATAFAPLMAMSSSDDAWSSEQGMVGGEYYYAVMPITVDGEQRVRILYMPA